MELSAFSSQLLALGADAFAVSIDTSDGGLQC